MAAGRLHAAIRRSDSTGNALLIVDAGGTVDPHGLTIDKIAERAEWVDADTFRMVRHGGGVATVETYRATYARSTKVWSRARSCFVRRAAWVIEVIASEVSTSRVEQEIAGCIADRMFR